ncbi:T-cell surface protein tactile [Tupaia chinensis]|uniref:T-cell surface protein tactile n=1 Tax=Tupaia chinensis TaxID=246437 RepID=L9KFA3_TUPCH|nr:T-cell surface protein tactile [Tupaia chinensis]
MEKKWTYCAVYSIIQIHFARGVWEEIFSTREDVYVLPGSDVNLTCQTQKKGFLVQMQWSKITDRVDLIALYHPQHGFHCTHGRLCESLVTFTEAPENVSKWTLHLRNASSLLSGKYECSFTLYPEGIQSKIYNLLIQTHGLRLKEEEEEEEEKKKKRRRRRKEEENCSLDINIFKEQGKEENGTQETLITQDHRISNSTLFKDRVKLGADYGLQLSPVQIHDDGQKFSCHARVGPDKMLRSSTTVKVFAKPEISMIVENSSMDVLGERTFTCSLRNVFPKANLTWYIDGMVFQGEEEGTNITNEERKGKGKFLELKSVLTRVHGNKPTKSNLTIWCVALSPAPGNKMWNVSSEKITFSFGSVNLPTDPPLGVSESTFSTHPSSANSETPTTVSEIPSKTYSSSPSRASSTLDDEVFTSTTRALSEVLTTANGSTKRNRIVITGTVINKPKDGMSWPVIVAALLFFCMVSFGIGVRKWCQYQKEIMERPPPFKPPPPPIKYTCIQEPIGSDLPCHEMETL